jgi:hypothetical protein
MAALQIVANIQVEMLEVFKIPKLVWQQLHVCGQSQMSKVAEMEELFWPCFDRASKFNLFEVLQLPN